MDDNRSARPMIWQMLKDMWPFVLGALIIAAAVYAAIGTFLWCLVRGC